VRQNLIEVTGHHCAKGTRAGGELPLRTRSSVGHWMPVDCTAFSLFRAASRRVVADNALSMRLTIWHNGSVNRTGSRNLLFSCIFISVAGFISPGNAASLNDTARLLAGLPVSGPLSSFTQVAGWQAHAAEMDKAWKTKEHFQLEPIASWMSSHAGEYYRSSGTMYYMFSGPDFLYANAFFPNASTYILAGLEPIGRIPDISHMSAETLSANLPALRNSMSTLLITHYFVTKEMKSGLGRGEVGGILPILYVFLARLDCSIVDTAFIQSPANGVKITFNRNGRSQTLYYFTTDLSGGNSSFLRWCAARGPGVSLIKAASFLMHNEGFSGVRNFLLDHSRFIVEDDSGIPVRAFGKNWALEFYGHFIPHNDEFAKYNQQSLAEIYHHNPPPPDLGFAFGYWWQADRGMLISARRK
jgi:hypothetical protein